MSRRSHFCFASLVVIQSTLFGIGERFAAPVCVAADPATDPELDEITQALVEWRKKIVNIHMTCVYTFDKGLLDSQDPGAPPPDVTTRSVLDWAWTDSGQLRFHETVYANDEVVLRTLHATNGERGYSFRYPGGHSEVDKPERVEVKTAFSESSRLVEGLLGLFYPNKFEWLPELLEAGKGTIVGHEQIEGVECPKLKVMRTPKIAVLVTLDPDHGLLPRLVELSAGIQQRTDEFRKVDPPGVWFPSSGTQEVMAGDELYSRKRWRMESLTINTSLDPKLFRPPIPKGIRVFDQFTGKSRRGGQTRTPQRPRNPTGNPQPSRGGGNVSAVPRDVWTSWSSIVLLLAAGLLLSASFLVMRRQQ